MFSSSTWADSGVFGFCCSPAVYNTTGWKSRISFLFEAQVEHRPSLHVHCAFSLPFFNIPVFWCGDADGGRRGGGVSWQQTFLLPPGYGCSDISCWCAQTHSVTACAECAQPRGPRVSSVKLDGRGIFLPWMKNWHLTNLSPAATPTPNPPRSCWMMVSHN